MGSTLRFVLAAAVVVFQLFVLGCEPKPLSTEGTVTLWAKRQYPHLATTSQSFEGMQLVYHGSTDPWLDLLASSDGLDVVVTELTGEVFTAQRDGLLLDAAPYAKRMALQDGIAPELKRALSPSNPESLTFFPATAYLWGLWYNATVLESHDVGLPANLEQLDAAFQSLREKGVQPISVGASFGWPALAWVSMLDLRINGLEAHLKLLTGDRPFDDPSLLIVYEKLTAWRDAGYFGPSPSNQNWPEALGRVVQGQAAFTLFGAVAAARVSNTSNVQFMLLPGSDRSDDQGELAVMEGFVVSNRAVHPEAALSLIDAYVAAGARDFVGGDYRVPVLRGAPESGAAPSSLAHAQAEALSSGSIPVPTLDRVLPGDVADDFARIISQFLSPTSHMTAEDLAAAFEAAYRVQ